MELLADFVHFFLHLDQHLNELIAHYGVWTYGILFLIIFCETGLVVTPILPGDSLLFAIGALAAVGELNVWAIAGLLAFAAIAGDSVNYVIGAFAGPKIFHKEKVRFLNREYLDRTHRFFEKYGGKTIIFARFIPIIRTFAPFVAGVGKMTYAKFLAYNVIGGVAWIFFFVFGGAFFGNLPFVKENFSLILVAIIFVSILPAIIEFFRARLRTARENA